jgi:hypothetical protein
MYSMSGEVVLHTDSILLMNIVRIFSLHDKTIYNMFVETSPWFHLSVRPDIFYGHGKTCLNADKQMGFVWKQDTPNPVVTHTIIIFPVKNNNFGIYPQFQARPDITCPISTSRSWGTMEQSARPCQQTCRRAVVRQAETSHVGMFSVGFNDVCTPQRIDSVGFPCRNPNMMIFWKKIWFFSSNSTSCLPIFPFLSGGRRDVVGRRFAGARRDICYGWAPKVHLE